MVNGHLFKKEEQQMESVKDTLQGYQHFKTIGHKLQSKTGYKPVAPSRTLETKPATIEPQPAPAQIKSDWLPDNILDLIDNKEYLPRHKKLARVFGSKYLIKLAELAETKQQPSHWYAKVTSKKNWEAITLPMLEKLFKAIETARTAISKLNMSNDWLRYYTKVAYRTSEAKFNSILEQAQTTAKTTPQYYFRYLAGQV